VRPEDIGQMGNRFREQARSHSWVGGGQLQVGGLLGRYRWQASSHRVRVRPGDIGQLVDRFREQARSHRKQKQDQKIAAFGSSYIWIALGFG
jgi:hypothetical protein